MDQQMFAEVIKMHRSKFCSESHHLPLQVAHSAHRAQGWFLMMRDDVCSASEQFAL